MPVAKPKSGKAEAATIEAMAQARKHGEAVFFEKARVEAANNTIASLTGKRDAVQPQIALYVNREFEDKRRGQDARGRYRGVAAVM